MVTEDLVFIPFITLLYLYSAGSISFLVLFIISMFYYTATNKVKFINIFHSVAIVMETTMFITCAIYDMSMFFDITKYGFSKPVFASFAMFVQSYVINYTAVTSTYSTLILVQSNYSKSTRCTTAGIKKYFLPISMAYIIVVSSVFAPIEGLLDTEDKVMLAIKYLSTIPPLCVCLGCMIYYVVKLLKSQKTLAKYGVEMEGIETFERYKTCSRAECSRVNGEIKYIYITLLEITSFLMFRLTETTVLSPLGYNFIFTIMALLFIHICVFILAYYFISRFIKKGLFDLTSRLGLRTEDTRVCPKDMDTVQAGVIS